MLTDISHSGMNRWSSWRARLSAGGTAALVAAALAACSPTVATRGNLVENDKLAQVQVGASTMDDVATVLGTPSTVATFDPRVWYYIGQRTEKTAFFDPDVIERRVLRLRFDDARVVQEIRELSLEDGQPVELVERETPTLGRQMTFFEQMLGNLGRFNNPSGRGGPATGQPPGGTSPGRI